MLGLLRSRCRPSQALSGAFAREASSRTAKEVKGKASRAKLKSAKKAQSWNESNDDDAQSRNFWALRPGVDRGFEEDALVAKKTLQWHRKEAQFTGEVYGCFLESQTNRTRWWDSWEVDWDDGWDWEQKWQSQRSDGSPAAPSEVIVGKDNPRRPSSPMWLENDGHYRPVPSLNHSQLAEAIVDAPKKKVDELHWQALCRRAELVAMSMTPAELLAVARCVAERQSGQLRLLWKIASLMVERIGSFTTTDLACLANVYSSLDAVHHGMLNVVALILASPEDEREMDAILAIDVLKSFARAQHPLPLLVNEVRRVLLSDPTELKPSMALSGLESFSKLKCLDGEILGCLLPYVLSTGPAAESVAQICAAASWAYRQKLEVQQMSDMSVSEALSDAQEAILSSVLERLQHCRWQQLQVLRAKRFDSSSFSSPQNCVDCVVVVPTSGQMASVKGELLLAAAQLLASQLQSDSIDSSPRQLAKQILTAAVGTSSKLLLWSVEQRVEWLTVAADLAERSQELPILALLGSFHSLEAAKLTMISPTVATVLPRILTYGQPVASEVSQTVKLVCEAVRQELYRLRLKETYQVLEGAFKAQALLGDFGESGAIELSVSSLLSAILDSLPAKFKSESVFHRKGVSQSGLELADWCTLLASASFTMDTISVPESIWKLLALECQSALAASGLGQENGESFSGAAVAKQMMDSFLKVKDIYHWDILDQETPLGLMSLAVQSQWKRAIARDGELEDPMHEPAPIPSEDALCLKHLFQESGIELPTEIRI